MSLDRGDGRYDLKNADQRVKGAVNGVERTATINHIIWDDDVVAFLVVAGSSLWRE